MSFTVTEDDCNVSSNMIVSPGIGAFAGAVSMGNLLNISALQCYLPDLYEMLYHSYLM